MKQSALTPVKLRLILVAIMFVLAAGGVGMFFFSYTRLQTHVAAAQEVSNQAEASRTSLQNLVAVKKFLAENPDAVTRASQLVALSQQYQYQDQIIQDITAYATRAGLTITDISFADTKTAATTPTATATGATGAAAAGATSAAPSGIKSVSATVTIKSPADYTGMLTFISLVEQSLFRMQVSRVGLSQAAASEDGASATGKVTSETFTIEVYIK